MNEATLKKLAKPLIVMATVIWGFSFVVMKNALDDFPPYFLIGARFLAAAVILAIVFFRRWRRSVDAGYLLGGGVMGLCLFLAYAAQTCGLSTTTPGKNAFLTAIYCVIVPFLNWAVRRQPPDRYNVLAAILCVAGIGLVSLGSAFTVTRGDALSLLGGFLFAAHIVSVAKFSEGRDIFTLTILQFAAAGVLALVCTLLLETPPSALPKSALYGLLYLTVAATACGLLLQNVGQKYTEPAAVAVLLSLEAPFGVLFSVLFYDERPTIRMFLGFALIFTAVLCSETKFKFLRNFKKRVDKNECASL